MEIKYFVRTIKTREFDYSQIEYTELVDKNPDFVQSFIDQLKIISEYDAVFLEDDCKLCKNFKEEIEKVIAKHPNDIISFFYHPKDFFTSHYTNHFMWNQCTYYPKGTAKIMADKMEELRRTNQILGRIKCYDIVQENAMSKLGIPNYVYRPCLVQHIGGTTSLIGNSGDRDTIFFKDYLDELGIDYLDSCKIENREKLKQLLDEDRKSWKL